MTSSSQSKDPSFGDQLSDSDMQSELKTFLTLLQNENQSLYRSLKCSGKLSIILSASEPQSSSIDKENSNRSANTHTASQLQDFQSSTERSAIGFLIKELESSGLSRSQEEIVVRVKRHVEELLISKENYERKIYRVEEQLGKEKKGTDDLLEALIKMDEEQKEVWNTYHQLCDRYNRAAEEITELKSDRKRLLEQSSSVARKCEKLTRKNECHEKNIQFMKKLIYLANEKYEELSKRHLLLQASAQKNKRKEGSPINSTQAKKGLGSKKCSERNLFNRQPEGSDALKPSKSNGSKNSRAVRHSVSIYEPENDSYFATRQHVTKNRLHSNFDNRRKSRSISAKSGKSLKVSVASKSNRSLSRDKENILSNDNCQQIYRQMIMKTFKNTEARPLKKALG